MSAQVKLNVRFTMHFSRNLKIAAIALATLTVSIVASWAFVFVPPSLQISLAGVAGCSATQEQWRQNADEHFEEVKFWELRMPSWVSAF